MRTIFLILTSILCIQQTTFGKNYHFDMKHSYEVQIVRVSQQGTKFLKVWGIAGSPDKAIDQAKQDAVAACIFTGIEGNEISGKIQPLATSINAYAKHQKFFDTFFKKGEFMKYVKNVNTGYPFGEDNISTSKGRRVGIYVIVMYDELRKLLEDKGIVRKLNSYF